MAPSAASKKYRVLVYAAERKGLAVPWEQIDAPKYTLSFASYDDGPDFKNLTV
jgi:hypothetical protein